MTPILKRQAQNHHLKSARIVTNRELVKSHMRKISHNTDFYRKFTLTVTHSNLLSLFSPFI